MHQSHLAEMACIPPNQISSALKGAVSDPTSVSERLCSESLSTTHPRHGETKEIVAILPTCCSMLFNGMHQRRKISPRSKHVAGECEGRGISNYHGACAKTLRAAPDTLQSKWHDPRQRSLYPETLALFAQTVA